MKNTTYTKNRELSWLQFNERVLEEANDDHTPLFERLKFLSIFISNLDEFYMIRVGSLYDLAIIGEEEPDNKSGMTPSEQLAAIFKATTPLYRLKDDAYTRIMNRLNELDIGRVTMRQLSHAQREFVEQYFKSSIKPLLSPQIIDNRHPFPHLDNKQLNIAVSLSHKDKSTFGIVPLGPSLKRVISLPDSKDRYVLLEDVILEYAESIFDMYKVVEKHIICVTRNADINIDEGITDDDADYRQHVKQILKKRARLNPVRLEVQGSISDGLMEYLCTRLELSKKQVFVSQSPLAIDFVFALENKLPTHLKGTLLYPPFTPGQPAMINSRESMLKQAMRRDILLSYPFESMQPFINLIKEAAVDKNVVSIKITLYRIDRDSKLARHLIEAAENGKEVTVLMELRARFDEQNNLEWAQILEESGCRVIYGLDGYKVHSKVCLITRQERARLSYITQIGTGNYNEKTAKQYTDLALITSNLEIGRDAVEFFKNMSIGNLSGDYKHLLVAPYSLKSAILAEIDREIQNAKAGEGGFVTIKMNSLTDKDVIDKLAEASQAGVEVKLIVRGTCCLIPKIPGYTDHITVISIVGRFLEHSRIYAFGRGDSARVYIGSADMMTRNTERRVEVLCPIYYGEIKNRLMRMLEVLLCDNVKAREQFEDSNYILRSTPADHALCAQEFFMKEAGTYHLATGGDNAGGGRWRTAWQRMFDGGFWAHFFHRH